MRTTLQFIAHHPLTCNRRIAALARVARWQIVSRVRTDVLFEWIEGARLIVRRGMTGATGNIYAGLHEFADMGFLIHLLRPGDLFVDAGANVGSFTVLASKVCGAKALAIEPDPDAMISLTRNIRLNEIVERVTTHECALGAAAGVLRFTMGRDTTNHVTADQDVRTREVPVRTLDDILGSAINHATFIKLDVEGYEGEVLRGAKRLLASPTLLAIQTELVNTTVSELLKRAGFVRRYYDPLTRSLSPEPREGAANGLFIRQEAACLARLTAAPRRTVLGRSF